MSLIEIEDLHHSYTLRSGETVAALGGLNVSIDSGEYIAVVGANGSGKTTFALHLNGILLPDRGSVTVDGLSTAERVREVRRRVGMVFQSPDDQFVATVVEEDVAFGPENLGVEAEELETVVRDALTRVGMWGERKRPPHQLSAGQKQRVAIAGALAMGPKCLVVDEVTSMLDPAGARDVVAILEDLNRSGMTIVTVTHKMQEAAKANRLLVLRQGKLVADAPPAQIFAHPDLTSWNLKPPPASILARRLQKRFPDLPDGVLDSEGLAQALIEVARR